GLIGLMGNQPIRASTLNVVPKTAAYAAVYQLDPGKILRQVRSTVASADPKLLAEYDKAMSTAAQEVGQDIQGFLDFFGDQWVVYSDAGVGGTSDQIVIVNELDDPTKAEDALNRLVAKGLEIAQQRGGLMGLTAHDVPLGDQLTVHTIQAPQGT